MIKKIKHFPIYLLLMAIYPSASLLAANYREIDPLNVIRPLLFSLLLSIVFFQIFSRLVKNKKKAGVTTTLFIFLFFSYGRVYDYMINLPGWFQTIGNVSHVLLGISTLAIFLIAINLLIKIKVLDTAAISIFCLTLLLLPGYQIGKYIFRESTPYIPKEITIASNFKDQPLPDVYHIVVDAYSREDYLAYLGYDNSTFLEFLESEGFYVADCSRSNYYRTALSLTATLNMDYLWRVIPDKKASDRDDEAVYSALSNSVVHNTFRNLGYKFITTVNGYAWSEHTRFADIVVAPDRNKLFAPYIFPFERLFIENSALRIILDLGFLETLKNGYILNGEHYDQVTNALQELKDISSIPGPTYSYFHLIVPHEPFVFSSNGDILPQAFGRDGYIRNIEFINNALMPILEDIIENSETRPVIILHGDHGVIFDKSRRYNILSAIYLPNGETNLYPTLSPVNYYRVIFNQIFDQSFTLLDDKSIQADIGSAFRKTLAELTSSCP